MSRRSVTDESKKLCGALADMGAEFYCEADNRGGYNSVYIFVRRPIIAKIRVADHASDRIKREQEKTRQIVLDVGPHGLSWQEAVARITKHAPAGVGLAIG